MCGVCSARSRRCRLSASKQPNSAARGGWVDEPRRPRRRSQRVSRARAAAAFPPRPRDGDANECGRARCCEQYRQSVRARWWCRASVVARRIMGVGGRKGRWTGLEGSLPSQRRCCSSALLSLPSLALPRRPLPCRSCAMMRRPPRALQLLLMMIIVVVVGRAVDAKKAHTQRVTGGSSLFSSPPKRDTRERGNRGCARQTFFCSPLCLPETKRLPASELAAEGAAWTGVAL